MQFRNQYTITKNLDLPGVVQPYSLETYRNSYALVMRDFGGISLWQYTKIQPLQLSEFLAIAIHLADILNGLYQHRVILKHRLKPHENHPAIEVVRDYGNLPQVECFAGQLNQVFMNLLANAIDALQESHRQRNLANIQVNPHQIIIQTRLAEDGQQVLIQIADNGVGMTQEVKQRVFDYLFTTKSVGQGTGLGLAIAQQIVVERHGGTLKVDSVLGKGTEFTIVLPVAVKTH